MRLKSIVLLCTFMVLISAQVDAAWKGPVTFFQAEWGEGIGRVRMDNGDGEDPPTIRAVTQDGKVVLYDMVSNKQVVIGPDGKVIKDVPWQVVKQEGGTTFYNIPEYNFFGEMIAYDSVGNVYVRQENKYYLLSPTGKILRTYSDESPDIKQKGYTDEVSRQGITRYNADKKIIAQLRIGDTRPRHYYDYGDPIVTPLGDVYVWKKTVSRYVILKWTWVDDPAANQYEAMSDRIKRYFQTKNYIADNKSYALADVEVWNVQNEAYSDQEKKLVVMALRNEIYARHGRRFENPELKAIFEAAPWYEIKKEFKDSELNDLERKNLEFMLKYEQKMGWR